MMNWVVIEQEWSDVDWAWKPTGRVFGPFDTETAAASWGERISDFLFTPAQLVTP